MIYSATQALHSQPVIGVSCSLEHTGGKIDELRPWLFSAVAGYWLEGQSVTAKANTSPINANVGPLAALTFRCAARGAVPFLVLETNGKSKK